MTQEQSADFIDCCARRLPRDPDGDLSGYFVDMANHISASTPLRGARYSLGYVSLILRLVIRWRAQISADSVRITVGSVNAVLLETPAHQDTIRACFGDGLPKPLDSSVRSGASLLHFPLWAIVGALPSAFFILGRISRLAPEFVRSRMEIFEFILQVISYSRSPLLKAVAAQPCVLTYEAPAINKAMAILTRRADQRVVHIMHGLKHPNFQVSIATDFVLLSKIDEPWFRARVAPSTRIWTIGHPRLESVRREVGTPVTGVGDRLPRIAFFSQPAEGDYHSVLRRRDWALLGSLAGRAELRFRLHPRESREEAERDLSELGLGFVELSEAGLVEDLRWCDAVASSWSTVSMEAAACGRGVFWTCSTPERYQASAELRDHGIGRLIVEPGDWQAPLEDWSKGGWREPVVVPEFRLRELGMIGDMETPWLERLALVDAPTRHAEGRSDHQAGA